jgi:subtilisin family serine protease
VPSLHPVRGRRARVISAIGIAVILVPLQARAVPATAAGESSSTPSHVVVPFEQSDPWGGEFETLNGTSFVKKESMGTVPPSDARADDPTAVPGGTGRFIVRLKRGQSADLLAADLQDAGIEAEVLTETAFQSVLVEPDPGELAALTKNPAVAAVSEDRIVSLNGSQSNPPWGLDRIDQGSLPLDNSYTWDTDGTGVTAYIVDTGTRGTHTDFGGRVQTGWNGTSDAGGGNSDCHGHGTHVAGTVAGSTYGVAKSATIVPIRVLSCSGSGYMSTIVQGIDWAIAHHDAGVPAVMNMSLGGPADSATDAAVAAAVADGIVVVVAAGNSNTDACSTSPARAPSAITVGAIDNTDAKAWFSNYGPCLDIWAPGVGTLSAYYTSDSATATMSGTSMASPHVAGAAARLLSANPALTVDQVTAIITGNTVLVGDRNILQSPLYAPAVVPSAPTGLTATPRNGAAVIQWDAPPAGVDAVTLTFSTGGSVSLSRRVTRYEKYDLVNGQAVTVTIRALNSRGFGASSATTVTPVDDGSPDRPTVGRIGSGNEWLNVEVQFPSVPSGGAVSSVTVTATPAVGSAVTATTTVDQGTTQKLVRVNGLTNLTTYTVTAVATNGSGSSTPSTGVSGTPSAPVDVATAWNSTTLSYPSPARAPMVVDEFRNLVWAGGQGRAIKAIDVETRMVASGTLPSGNSMWLVMHESTNRVFAVPHQGGAFVYELSVSGSTVTATSVASTGVAAQAVHLDQSTGELLLVGASLKRYSIGSSGALTALTVPVMNFGGQVGTSIDVHGTRVAIGSNLGGWVKLWNRANDSVSEVTGIERVGTLHAMDAGVLVTPTKASTVRKVSWGGVLLATLDLQLPVFAGGTFNSYTYAHRYADVVDTGTNSVTILHEGQLVSLDVSTMTVKASGSGFIDDGALAESATGVLLAGAWLTDLGDGLRSRWRDYAVGSFSSGFLLNAARRAIGGERFGAIYVETVAGGGVRIVERASSPLNVVVESGNGSARITWQQPARITDAVDPDADAEYQLRPVTYDVILEPGNIVRKWRGGELDMVVQGLNPGTTYTAVVRARSPGGWADSELETFTPISDSARPSTPASVTITTSAERCVTVSWAAATGATAGYRVQFSGRVETASVSAGVTSHTQCALVTTEGVFPTVSARVTALSSTAESIPSEWTAGVTPTKLPVFEGSVHNTAFSESLGVAAATAFSVTASESSERRQNLVIMDDNAVRTRPMPEGAPVIVGIDEMRREVIVARCNVVNGGIMTVSIDDPAVSREIELPVTNQWEFCSGSFDPVRRAVWLAPTIYAVDDNFDVDGADVVAVSVDVPGRIVASSNLTCQPGTWTTDVYVAATPRFTVDNGTVLASCMSRNSSGFKPEFSVVTNALTGAVVRTHTAWLSAVGATDVGDPITVTDDDVTIHSASPVAVTLGQSLGYGATTLGRPVRENDVSGARVYRRSGNYVTVLPNSGQLHLVDLAAGTSRRLSITSGSFAPSTVLASGEAAVRVTDTSVEVATNTGLVTRPTPSRVTSFTSLPRGGQRVGAWGYWWEPVHLHWMGPQRMIALTKLRVPDNFGVPTDETFYSAFWNIRPPSRPVVTGRSSGSVSWSQPGHSPGLVPGSTTRWEMNLPATSTIVRDAEGTTRCTTTSTSCSSSGNFAAGASFQTRSIAGINDRMLIAEEAVDSVVTPMAPRLVPRPPSAANTLSVHVGLTGASATSWELECNSRGGSIVRTGTSPGIENMTARPGLWICRVRAANGNHAGDWGNAVVAESRPAAGISAPLTVGSGTIAMTGGSGSFTCRSGASSASGTAGQTVTVAAGQWSCAVVLPDQSSVGVTAHVSATPAPATGLTFQNSGSRVLLSFSTPANALIADAPASVECSGAVTYSGTAQRTVVDIGAVAAGTVNCTVARNFLLPGSSTPAATATASASYVPARSLRVRVTGGGTVTRSGGSACSDDCTELVEGASTASLSAVPASGWLFDSWSTSGCSGLTCSVDLTAVDTVDVVFTAAPTTTPATTTTTTPPTTTTVAPTTTPAPTTTTVAPTTTPAPTTTAPVVAVSTVLPPATPTTALPPTSVAQAPGATPATTVPVAPPAVKTSRYTRTLLSTASRVSVATAMSRVGISAPTGARTAVTVSSTYAKVCRVSGTTIVRTSTRSACVATVTMTGTTLKKVVTLTIRRPG